MNIQELQGHVITLQAVRASIPAQLTMECPDVNKTNLDHAIAVMERVSTQNRKFSLNSWFAVWDLPTARIPDEQTEAMQMECGTSACAVGWISTTDQWRAAGGSIKDSEPCMTVEGRDEPLFGCEAAAHWLNIPVQASRALFLPDGIDRTFPFADVLNEDGTERGEEGLIATAQWVEYDPYPNGIHAVTAEHVATALKQIRDTGSLVATHNPEYSTMNLDNAIGKLTKAIARELA